MNMNIKRMLIRPVIVVGFICLTAMRCVEVLRFDVNRTSSDIYAICDLDAYDNQITPNRSKYLYCNHSHDIYKFMWDRGLWKAIPNDTIDFYILSAGRDLLDQLPDNTANPLTQSDVDKILDSDIIARYRLSPKDRENLSFTIYFPPSYEMRKMKMTPSYEYLVATYGK